MYACASGVNWSTPPPNCKANRRTGTAAKFSGGAGSAAKYFRVPKWCKLIVAVLLLPVCAGAGITLWRVLLASGSADTIWLGVEVLFGAHPAHTY